MIHFVTKRIDIFKNDWMARFYKQNVTYCKIIYFTYKNLEKKHISA